MRPVVTNTIIEWPSDEGAVVIERVLWIDPNGVGLVVIPLLREKDPLPIWKTVEEIQNAFDAGAAVRRPTDPYTSIKSPTPEFLERHKHSMEDAWQIISELVVEEPDIYDQVKRGELIKQLVKNKKVLKKIVYKYLKRYWLAGKTKYALLPHYNSCGAPGEARIIVNKPGEENSERPKRGRPSSLLLVDPSAVGININQDYIDIFKIAIKIYYNNRDKHPLRKAFQTMNERYFNCGYQIEMGNRVPVLLPPTQRPTFEQFQYWTKKERSAIPSLIAREGKRKFALKSRAILGKSTQMAFGPGSIFQVDATIADIYLVSGLDRSLIIGRPVIYMVMDTFSRMIVGLYVGLEGPSWVGAMMAIANATTEKISFCAEYDIEITEEVWPCHYLCDKFLADRGEFLGYNSDVLVDGLNISIANCPPYRADWKGIVEQSFRLLNVKTIHWQPGAVRGRERGERDHRLDATLDLREFTQLMIYTAIRHNLHHRIDDYPANKDMIRDHVQPIPIDLWEWGIRNRTGLLREETAEVIRLNLMPRGTATVTAEGIQFEGIFYSSEQALNEHWFERARREGVSKIQIVYDPRKPTIIYHVTNGNIIEPCTLLPKDERFSGQQLEEVIDFFASERIRKKIHKGRESQSDATLHSHINVILDQAKDKTNRANDKPISNRQKLKSIRENRRIEKVHNRKTEAFDLNGGGNLLESKDCVQDQSGEGIKVVPESSAVKNKKLLEMLKSQQGAVDDNA